VRASRSSTTTAAASTTSTAATATADCIGGGERSRGQTYDQEGKFSSHGYASISWNPFEYLDSQEFSGTSEVLQLQLRY
jgi:hypothetical protein